MSGLKDWLALATSYGIDIPRDATKREICALINSVADDKESDAKKTARSNRSNKKRKLNVVDDKDDDDDDNNDNDDNEETTATLDQDFIFVGGAPKLDQNLFVFTPRYIDIDDYRFFWPQETTFKNYKTLVCKVQRVHQRLQRRVQQKQKWDVAYYASNSNSGFYRFLFSGVGGHDKGLDYVAGTFPHIRLQAFLQFAGAQLDLQPYNGDVGALSAKNADAFALVTESKNKVFQRMSAFGCARLPTITISKPRETIWFETGIGQTNSIDVAALTDRDERAFYETVLQQSWSASDREKDVQRLRSDADARRMHQLLSDEMQKHFTYDVATNQHLYNYRHTLGAAHFDFKVYCVTLTSRENTDEHYLLVYTEYQYTDPNNVEAQGTYNGAVVIQSFANDVGAIGLPSQIVRAGAYQCKIVDYAQQCMVETRCVRITRDYLFVGHLMTDLWPMHELLAPQR